MHSMVFGTHIHAAAIFLIFVLCWFTLQDAMAIHRLAYSWYYSLNRFLCLNVH